MRKLLALLSVSYLFVPQALAASWVAPSVPGEIVIKLKENKSSQLALSAIKKLVNAQEIKFFQTDSRFGLVKLATSVKSVSSAIELLKHDPRIEIAEPNFIYSTGVLHSAPANDPELGKLWSFRNTGQLNEDGMAGKKDADINLFPLWEEGVTGSAEIKVAVIDTGVSLNHPDLVSNIWTNPGEIPNNGIDDDQNGFIDDVHGWNFITNTPNANDDNNHGSHCAGVIGASGNDGLGIVGVNWKVSIIPLKFLDQAGSGSLANAIQAVQYATRAGVQIMSNSWSGGGFSQALLDAIIESKNKGIIFVAASGNNASNSDAYQRFPASYSVENIISVAATDNQDRIASFSNYGKNTVHVAAPGVDILSAAKDSTYEKMSGTSMATPHVAAIAALMLSKDSSLTYSDVKDILIRSSVPQRSFARKVVSGGRVDAYNAVHRIFPVVSRPDESQWRDVSFSFESPHPYANNYSIEKEVSIPGAKYLRVVIESYDTEANYDIISVIDGMGNELERISGKGTQYVSEYAEGSKMKIKFTTDVSATQYGFKISKVQVIY